MKVNKNILDVIDRRVGLINYLESVELKTMSRFVYRYVASIKQNIVNKEFPGSGFSLIEEDAKISAIGEAVERYCALIDDSDKILIKRAIDLNVEYLSPDNFNRYTMEQYSNVSLYKPFNDLDNIKWVKSICYGSGKEVYLPYETIYLKFPDYRPFREIISTGLACGPDIEFAFERGLYECIERDAFMLFWLLGYINYEIDINSINDIYVKKIMQVSNNHNLNIRIFDISQSDIKAYTILALVKSDGRDGFYMASSTNCSLIKAIRGALDEGVSGYTAFLERIHFYDLKPPKHYDDIKTLEDHASYYVSGNYDEILEKVIPNDLLIKEYPEVNSEYTFNQTTNSIMNMSDIYYCDITSLDVESIGLKVVRVVIPKLIYLPMGPPMLESNRLREKAINARFDELNLIPHPFP